MAPPGPSRRRLLRAAGAAATAALAGCGFVRESASRRSVTPAPVPTDIPSPTPQPTPVPPKAEDFSFDVTVSHGFTEARPARLEIAFRNTGDQLLTGVGQRRYVLPFVDDDYAGRDAAGRQVVFLAPDDDSLAVQPRPTERGLIREYLPGTPDEGCWRLPFDWPEDRVTRPTVLRTVSVAPGVVLRHGYGLYFIDECVSGTVSFHHAFGLATGAALVSAQFRQARLGFDLTIAADGAVAVAVHEPVVFGTSGGE